MNGSSMLLQFEHGQGPLLKLWQMSLSQCVLQLAQQCQTDQLQAKHTFQDTLLSAFSTPLLTEVLKEGDVTITNTCFGGLNGHVNSVSGLLPLFVCFLFLLFLR